MGPDLLLDSTTEGTGRTCRCPIHCRTQPRRATAESAAEPECRNQSWKPRADGQSSSALSVMSACQHRASVRNAPRRGADP